MLTKNNSKKIKHITDEKINLYYGCDASRFKKFEADQRDDRNNKQAIFQNCTPFMDCITNK